MKKNRKIFFIVFDNLRNLRLPRAQSAVPKGQTLVVKVGFYTTFFSYDYMK